MGHPGFVVLVIMGTLSKQYGYRALSRFIERHQTALLEAMELPNTRLPSRVTIRNVMIHLDYVALTDAFNRWAIHSGAMAQSDELQHLAADGKAIRASLSDYSKSYQDFVSIVSMFNVTTGQVVALAPFQNKQTSEEVIVQQLLELLQVTGAVISADSLHCKTHIPLVEEATEN